MRSLVGETTTLLTRAGKTTHLTMLMGGVTDPVDAGIVADGVVEGVDHDDLEPLVGRVLTNPVGVEDAESTTATTDTSLGKSLEVSLRLLLVDTSVGGLTVVDTLGKKLLAITSLDLNTVNAITLLGLVTETVSLIRSRTLSGSVDGRQLPELPSSQTKQESHDIRLLLVPQLLQILVCSHSLIPRLISRTSDNDTY